MNSQNSVLPNETVENTNTNICCYDVDGNVSTLVNDGEKLGSIRNDIQNENVVILKNFVSEDAVLELKQALYEWGKTQEIYPPQSHSMKSFHTFEMGVSPGQKTLHYYHAYNLNDYEMLPAALKEKYDAVFLPMKEFYNAYTGYKTDFKQDETGQRLHPQAIHYPTGGGYLGSHIHKKDPQQIGLILQGSQKGTDFESGGVGFSVNNNIVDTSDVCEYGDMVVFNYGQVHWVTPCDIEKPMDVDSPDGRWVFTLPYN